ncbi:hypothetical protein [Pseudoalteromonas sp. SR45-4]|uniref:hypothetical protein n=1 Tax=Pseudoalteromonas sp. SR45-4 TaxID=2760929 RepID=UPI0015FBEA78|nr:hypothetical protein [Pseudoalteromonas sp. SR45-4]MBB1371352.1 hypothetical protein [Pseudoalteromonas sp. SR45-4]
MFKIKRSFIYFGQGIMDIGILDNNSYRSVQIAQTSFILSMRDIARIDPVSVAYLFKITKEEAKRLAETPVHLLEEALHSSPPLLTVKGQDGRCLRGASPMGALLDSLASGSVESFHNTAAHINAFSAIFTSSQERNVLAAPSVVAR